MSSYNAILITGLPTSSSDPNAKEIKKIKKLFRNEQLQERTFGKDNMPLKFHLFKKKWYNGSIECEGYGVFIFEEETPVEHLATKLDLRHAKINDKKYTMYAYPVRACLDCYCPLETDKYYPGCRKPSAVDSKKCMVCEPDLSCCCCKKVFLKKKEIDVDYFMPQYNACDECFYDREKQEEWRNTVGREVTSTTSSYEEEIHLSDEAIKKEKERMGGVPQNPHPDETPFSYSLRIEHLLDPTSRDYWPYGMTSLQYLEHRKLMKFNNPLMETAHDDHWQGIEVTDEVLKEYFSCLGKAMEKCHFEGSEEMEHIPKEITYCGDKFRLVDKFHGFTCDISICQAVFQKLKFRDDDQAFNFTQFGIGNIPMFTTRKGDLNGNGREMGYGMEKCIACVLGTMEKLETSCMSTLGDEID